VWSPGFSLSASLRISPSIMANIRQAKEDYEAGLLNYAAARQELEFQARRLYCNILVLRANTRLMEQNAASSRSRYEQIRTRQQTGQASNLDELSARLDVQTQETSVRSAATAYENALDSLKNLLVIPPEENLSLRGSLQTLSVSEENAGAGISGQPLALEVVRKNIAALETQRKGLRIDAYGPSLEFAWNATPLYSSKNNNWTDSGGQFSIGLSLKLDNFLPWAAAQEEIDSLGDAIAARKNLLRETTLNHGNTVRTLRRNIIQSARNIETLRLNVTLAEENRGMYEEAYRRGAADLQSLYSARDNVLRAENQLLSEHYNLAAAALDLEKELSVPFGTLIHWQ
ncbi:MAG: TolC family protein, partial [Spirochaetia bacterium]|jgi:outer membrane protein TolC|nr:TolC family protein [Spirochaetia bacterium]